MWRHLPEGQAAAHVGGQLQHRLPALPPLPQPQLVPPHHPPGIHKEAGGHAMLPLLFLLRCSLLASCPGC